MACIFPVGLSGGKMLDSGTLHDYITSGSGIYDIRLEQVLSTQSHDEVDRPLWPLHLQFVFLSLNLHLWLHRAIPKIS